MSVQCPTCGQPWPETPGRVCFACKKPIGIHDRWHILGSVVQHRDCADPTLGKAEMVAAEAFTLPLLDVGGEGQ